MPLPLGSCADDIAPYTCCMSVFDVADRLRCVTTVAVEACFDPSCADREWRSYVSVGPTVPEPLGDALVVHMVNIAPSQQSRGPNGTLLGAPLHIAQFDIMLVENGWPMITANEFGEVIEVPDSSLINRVALHAYGHGEKLYRTVVDGLARNTMFPVASFPNIGKVELSPMRPRQPAAFTVGWSISLNVQITFPPLIEQGS